MFDELVTRWRLDDAPLWAIVNAAVLVTLVYLLLRGRGWRWPGG
jgi:hypothetical protein